MNAFQSAMSKAQKLEALQAESVVFVHHRVVEAQCKRGRLSKA